NVVIRRGLQYLLAKNVLRMILMLPVIGLIVSNRNRTISEIVLHSSIYFYLCLAAIIALSLKFRNDLSNWIDKKFFRDSYNQEQILLTLVDEVKRLDSISQISRRVSDELEAALHPKAIYVFYRDEENRDLTLGHS